MGSKISALVLVSGGLDSLLAAKLLKEEGIKVKGLVFTSAFFDGRAGQIGCKQLGIECRIVDFSSEHLEIVKRPCFGRGRAANPCIDCHLLMLKKAKEILNKEGYDFVVTGEVLGERPLSQNKRALELIAKESGLGGYLLRPLSAKLLPVTLAEKKGWVSQKALLSISGRRRQPQMDLAKKLGLTKYLQPSGGCILTEKNYGRKLLEIFVHWPDCQVIDVQLLRLGRLFWRKETLIVLGRNHEENQQLEQVKQTGDLLILPKNFPGPTALIRGRRTNLKKTTEQLILKHSQPVDKPKFLTYVV
ncbi:tRNA 4-thiouridine(8) synthase ThiI [Patescibacteria group bacterium]|nr:tRNA 4-thiouridine(8) synthase ThiI [Patescibacteria group bacterium]MBU1931819.1 tRNA 4-thiouridine(8) synthase ThiI [Patescibacteria group bacterium]